MPFICREYMCPSLSISIELNRAWHRNQDLRMPPCRISRLSIAPKDEARCDTVRPSSIGRGFQGSLVCHNKARELSTPKSRTATMMCRVTSIQIPFPILDRLRWMCIMQSGRYFFGSNICDKGVEMWAASETSFSQLVYPVSGSSLWDETFLG